MAKKGNLAPKPRVEDAAASRVSFFDAESPLFGVLPLAENEHFRLGAALAASEDREFRYP